MSSLSAPRRRTAVGALAALVAVSSLAACGDKSEGSGASKAALKITVISGPLADPFFGAMKAGTEQAAKDLGVKVTWNAPKDASNPGPDYSRIGDAAVAGKPDGVVLTYFSPEAQDPSLNKLTDAKVPVVFMNSGTGWDKLGGLNYVGEDATVVGTGVGERFLAAKRKNVICFNHAPGLDAVQRRCDALKETLEAAGGVKYKEVDVPLSQGQNPTVVSNALAGALKSDPSIDAVFTLGSSVAEVATKVIDDAGSDAMLGTTDLSSNVLQLIKSGDIAFASDQQPYLTGYYSVQILAQYLRTGVHPIGSIDTAPNWITKDNVDDVISINKANNGIRGAS